LIYVAFAMASAVDVWQKQYLTGGGPSMPPSSHRKLTADSRAQGTNSSKKKKGHKLKRAMQAVKKAERRQAGSVSESFAAMQLLHDPQVPCWAFAFTDEGLAAVSLLLRITHALMQRDFGMRPSCAAARIDH
jgi:hypothetical protein